MIRQIPKTPIAVNFKNNRIPQIVLFSSGIRTCTSNTGTVRDVPKNEMCCTIAVSSAFGVHANMSNGQDEEGVVTVFRVQVYRCQVGVILWI